VPRCFECIPELADNSRPSMESTRYLHSFFVDIDPLSRIPLRSSRAFDLSLAEAQ